MQPLRRSALPDDLQPILRANGVTHCVAVQARQSLDETRWLLQLAQEHAFIAGVVGWIDLQASDLRSTLRELIDANPKLVGVRHVVHDEADPGWIVRAEVLRGLEEVQEAGLRFDLLMRPIHLKRIPVLGQRLPGMPMVLDHLGKPDIRGGAMQGWSEDLAAAACVPDLACKLSGLITEADHDCWTADDLRPFVQHAVDCFGTDRVMFGSDWPVSSLAGSYEDVVRSLREALPPLTENQMRGVMGGVAARFYGLEQHSLGET